MTPTPIDRLKEDPPIPGQRFYNVSFVSPEGIRNCTVRLLKVRGFFETQEEAKIQVDELMAMDPLHHVFTGEVGKWNPWDPQLTADGMKQVFQEEELQKLMEGHEDNIKKSKQHAEQRRQDSVKQAAYNHQQVSSKEKITARLRKKLAEKQAAKEAQIGIEQTAQDSMKNLLPISKQKAGLKDKKVELGSQAKQVSKEVDRLATNSTALHNQQNQLDKVRSLYKKMQDKQAVLSSSSSSSS